MSEFTPVVVKLGEVIPHPNADTLSTTTVLNGYPVVFKTGDFKTGDLAGYVPVDSIVDLTRPEFSWLDKPRVRAKRLRGVFSMGLLVPAPLGSEPGDPVPGVTKYVTPAEREPTQPRAARRTRPKDVWVATWIIIGLSSLMGLLTGHLLGAAIPNAFFVLGVHVATKPAFKPKLPYYDIQAWRQRPNAIEPGRHVYITEKIHGMNAAFVYTHGELYARSRTVFRRLGGSDVWSKIAADLDLENRLKQFPDIVFYGEIYGVGIQDMTYNTKPAFRVFDAWDLKNQAWLPPAAVEAFALTAGLPMVPVLYTGPWHPDLLSHAEGKTTLNDAKHVREGIVITTDDHAVQLKHVGTGYHLRVQSEPPTGAPEAG